MLSMIKKIIFGFIVLFWPIAAIAAPSITDITWSGSLADETVITITGSSFGSKTNAKPVAWADFEGGSIAFDTSLCVTETSIVNNSSRVSIHSTEGDQPHTDSNYCGRSPDFSGLGGSYIVTIGLDDSNYANDHWYVFCRRYYDSGLFDNNNSTNVKLDGRFMTSDEKSQTYIILWSTDTNQLRNGEASCTANDSMTYQVYDYLSEWFTVEWEMDQGDAGSSNGVYHNWINGSAVSQELTDMAGRCTGEGTWCHLNMQVYFCDGDDLPSSTKYAYWDDFYVDNTWSRVMVGDNATYESCTWRHPVIPTAWADGEITAEFKRGGQTGTAYIFVVDSSGDASTGEEITIGGTGNGTPQITGITIVEVPFDF